MRIKLIAAFLVIMSILLIGCGGGADNQADEDIASAIPTDETRETAGGGNSEADEAPQSEKPDEAPAESLRESEESPPAMTETPGPEDSNAGEDFTQERPDEPSDEDIDADTATPATPAVEDSTPPQDNMGEDPPAESNDLPSPEIPNETPTPEEPPAQEAIVGLWKPVDIDWQGNEEENTAASMLGDSLCIFSADGSFRILLPSSFLEFMQDDSSSDMLFSTTNGTWERTGVASDGNAVYSLSIPVLISFGFGTLDLQVIDGYIVFEGYDQMRLSRFE